MNADFTRWAAELAQDTETVDMVCVCGHNQARHEHHRRGTDCVVCGCMTFKPPPSTVSVTVTVGWLIILALVVLVFIGAAWAGAHIIQWVSA